MYFGETRTQTCLAVRPNAHNPYPSSRVHRFFRIFIPPEPYEYNLRATRTWDRPAWNRSGGAEKRSPCWTRWGRWQQEFLASGFVAKTVITMGDDPARCSSKNILASLPSVCQTEHFKRVRNFKNWCFVSVFLFQRRSNKSQRHFWIFGSLI